MKSDKRYFTGKLLKWNDRENKRLMPWKAETDPYKIWLSEIILQQTRVEQGWEYYIRFITAYPTIKKLAKAPEQKVFKLWEGLGYYTRCKNLVATAKFIANERHGKFPDTYDEILTLKGIGPYTAAAIASFAFNLPYAVIDGNVFRVLSRFFGLGIAIDSAKGKKVFASLAAELLDKKYPGVYNQAIMDFGAVICKPQKPLCSVCPLKNKCAARLQGKIDLLPVKAGKQAKRHRWFYYLIVEHQGKYYVKKRGAKDIWENLYEFILMETENPVAVKDLTETDFYKKAFDENKTELIHVSRLYKQQLTHQVLQGRFVHVKLKNSINLKDYQTVTYRQISKLPFPKFIAGYLAENELKAFER
jgi:A/G-specific adenine glycosylase